MRCSCVLALVLAASTAAATPDTFYIPIPGYQPGFSPSMDMVYDSSRNTLFVSNARNAVDRIHVPTRSLLPRFTVGSFMPAIELTADHSALLLAEEGSVTLADGLSHVVLHRVDPDTGAVSEIDLGTTTNPADGTADVVALKNGRAYVTPNRGGSSGSGRLREVDLTTGAVVQRTDVPFSFGRVQFGSRVWTGLDRSRLFLHEGNSSSPDGTILVAATNTFGPRVEDYSGGCFSPDGQRLISQYVPATSGAARYCRVVDGGFNLIANIYSDIASAYAYDPSGQFIYLADRITGEFVTISAQSYQVISRFQTGLSLDSALRMTVSDDGLWAFVQAEQGVLAISIPSPGTAASLTLLSGLALRRARRDALSARHG